MTRNKSSLSCFFVSLIDADGAGAPKTLKGFKFPRSVHILEGTWVGDIGLAYGAPPTMQPHACGNAYLESYYTTSSKAHGLPIRQEDVGTQGFCYPCSRFVGGSQWKKHCDWHLSRLESLDCDEINFRSIILQPRLCSFCIGDHTLKPEKRWANLTDQAPA
jgi:hypothetical protein